MQNRLCMPAPNISIHIPRGGDDLHVSVSNLCTITFQSTSPVGGMTFCLYFYLCYLDLFQSTSPVGGMTYISNIIYTDAYISIHIPRGGDDKHSK